MSKYLTKTGLCRQLKSHIGKPFTTREGVKQMKDIKKCINNPPSCLVKVVLQNICLVSMDECNAN